MTTQYTRPNGKTYRPRNPDQRLLIPYGDIAGPGPHGVIVIGTHDPADAHPRAVGFLQWITGEPTARASEPLPGWYRTGYNRSDRAIIPDEIHGRPGIAYTCHIP